MMRLWDSKGSVNLLRISYVSLTNLHTRRFRLTVSFCRFLSSFYESYRMGRSSPSTSLMPQLVQAVILPQHGASADSKGSGNFLRISSVLPTSLHIRRFAVAVSFRRKLLTLRQLSHGQNICFYFADASARTSSDTASTWCV